MFWRKHFELILLGFFICLANCGDSSYSKKNHSKLKFLRVGNLDGIINRFGTSFYETLNELNENKDTFDRFLLSIAEHPLTKKQISERSGLSQTQVNFFISKLEPVKIIKKDDQNRWATTVAVITDRQMKVIRTDLIPMARSVAQYLMKETHQLKTLYNRAKSPLDPSWNDVTHLIIDKLIIDGTFHNSIVRLEQARNNRVPGIHRKNIIPAFFLEQAQNFSNFGTNWYAFNQGDDQREVYVLHGSLLHRSVIAMNKYRGDQRFASLLFKITEEAEIHLLADYEREILFNLNWLEEDRLLVHIVKSTTIKSLLPDIEKIGRDAADVAFGHFENIINSVNKAPHSKFLEDDQDYIQVCYHVLFVMIIEQLIENGVVSRIPEPVPDSFGVYFVFGKLF